MVMEEENLFIEIEYRRLCIYYVYTAAGSCSCFWSVGI